MKYALLFLAVCNSVATAQTITGNSRLSAQCNGLIGVPFTAGTGSGSLHGDCPGVGGSSSDAACSWTLDPGSWLIAHSVDTEHRSTNPNGASAESTGLVMLEATDLVFTDTANPSSREYVRAGLNFTTAIWQTHVGASNCSEFLPNILTSFDIRFGDLNARGSRGYLRSQGEYSSGMILLGEPVDGTPVARTTTQTFVRLGDAIRFTLVLDSYAMVGYCGQPPAPPEHGSGDNAIRFRLPCDGPVFSLPPGITVSSVQLRIENNRWVGGGGACCPADFNGDGFLDFFDYADYVDCFATGVCPPGRTADFNGDGFADFFDYADFVDAFSLGC